MSHTVYRRPATGRTVVGLPLPSPGAVGEATFSVEKKALDFASLGVPKVGDRIEDGAGRKWTVTAVGAPAEGKFPLACTGDPP